jgi:hypothetical protein
VARSEGDREEKRKDNLCRPAGTGKRRGEDDVVENDPGSSRALLPV